MPAAVAGSPTPASSLSRRRTLALLTGAAWPSLLRAAERDPELRGKALIAITLDLEMSRNFPTWETTHWDYEKGNLNEESKQYTVEAARRIKSAGGVLHTFAVGQVFEQENIDWLKGLLADGHLVGNHTYDHVNVTAKQPEEIQHRFRRAPWLIAGKPVEEVLRDNIAMNAQAIRTRLGVEAAGFRTPGGFRDGLASVPHIQSLLLDLGYTWVSSKYPGHAMNEPGEAPSEAIYDGIARAQAEGQPFTYPSGLIEIPMSAPSDINAFRRGRWKVDHFREAVRRAVAWTIDNRAVFDFLGHPSCLYVTDPRFQAIDMICELVNKNSDRAALVDLATIARLRGRRA
jgi:peptidoglycan/xylan/chitin deacetylase (PgdA/CDA1 family)